MKTLEKSFMTFIFITFALSLAIVLTIFISPLIYSLTISIFNLEPISGLGYQQLMDNYTQVLEYLVNPNILNLEMVHFSSSAGGLQHFSEVKTLVMINFVVCIIFLILTLISIIKINQKQWQLLMRPYYSFAVVLPLILLSGIIIAFDQVFVLFHKVLFSNDLWLFNPALDPVITVLPQELFMLLFIIALLLYELVIFVVRLLTRWRRI